MRFFTVTAPAVLKAASVAARSPISHLNATLPGAPSCSVGAPHEGGVRHPRNLQIIDVLAAPRDEARVLASLDRFTEEPFGGDGGHDLPSLLRGHVLGRPLDRLHDVVIAGAPAEIAFQL